MDLQIRPEDAGDAGAIQALTIAAFRDAPHTSGTEHLIVSELRRSAKLAVSLVALAGETLVGHVAVSAVSISDGTPGWFGLGPISVLPRQQRSGIGSSLMREALRALQQRAAAGCVFLGEPAFYGRFGFKADPDLTLHGVPREYFLALSFGASRPRGNVTYAPAFAA